MSQFIRFKPSFLTKGIWLSIVICGCLSLMIFLRLNIELEYRYLLSMIIVFIGILIVFYINRFEPSHIQIDNETICIDYFNKAFFKRKAVTFSKDKLSVSSRVDRIKVYTEDTLQAIIRKECLDLKDWEALKNVFAKNSLEV